jgi:hypothetical protein
MVPAARGRARRSPGSGVGVQLGFEVLRIRGLAANGILTGPGGKPSVTSPGWPPSPPPPPRCQAALRAHGAHIQLIDVGPGDHNSSLILAFPKLLSWFQHLS